MAVLYGKFEMPIKIVADKDTVSNRFARFVAEPFERGFGHTVGNAMRRVLLTALEAPAIVGVRIEGVAHEYTAVEGIIEDMTNIVLNFKGALLRKLPLEGEVSAREQRLITSIVEVTQEDLDANGGQVAIKLGRVVPDGQYEVVNPDHHLFTVTKPCKRQVDIRIGVGRGYVPSERHIVADRNVGEVLIDSAYSPVRLVNYFVENTRVGQDTDFDRLILEVHTDGRITPQEAVGFAAQILIKQVEVMQQIEKHEILFEENVGGSEASSDDIVDKLCLRIDEIELSVRSYNCLKSADIGTIAELVTIPEKRMLDYRNFGKKSLNEIKAKLYEMGLSLEMDLSKYHITQDNVREKIQELIEERKARKEASSFDESMVR